MSERIQKGDIVRVVMDSNRHFPWQSACDFEATYIGGPGGPGDTFRVTRDDYGPVEINGNSSAFVGMYRVAPPSPTEEPNG